MSDTNQNSNKYKNGDRVQYRPHPLDEANGLDFRCEGIVESTNEDEVSVKLDDGTLRDFLEWELEPYVDYTSLDERERLKYRYSEWVHEYSGLLDKIHITMDEVQSKYSELAINFAISELERISESSADGNTRRSIDKRISHLRSLVG